MDKLQMDRGPKGLKNENIYYNITGIPLETWCEESLYN